MAFLTPDLGAFLPFFIPETVLLTSENALFALLIDPRLPKEAELLTAFIPAFTASLKLETLHFRLFYNRIIISSAESLTASWAVSISGSSNPAS